MISTLNKIGIEPQAVEQPLDLTIPENKIMLAFYLSAPEVENDRRSLNTIGGMRRAKKKGGGSQPRQEAMIILSYQKTTNILPQTKMRPQSSGRLRF